MIIVRLLHVAFKKFLLLNKLIKPTILTFTPYYFGEFHLSLGVYSKIHSKYCKWSNFKVWLFHYREPLLKISIEKVKIDKSLMNWVFKSQLLLESAFSYVTKYSNCSLDRLNVFSTSKDVHMLMSCYLHYIWKLMITL